MPVTFAPHNRIIASGTFDATAGVSGEIWSFSLCDDSGMAPSVLAPLVAPVIQTWFHLASSNMVTTCSLTAVRVERVNSDGTIATSYSVPVTAVGAISPAQNMPAICCAAITLETAGVTPKGARVRGRFYPPNQGWQCLNLGFGVGVGLNIAQSGSRLVTSLNAAGAAICVASQTGGGQNVAVTGCSADNVVDTIRRRKNNAVGARGTQSLPYP